VKPRHLVVAGHGMAGHRLVRELRDRDSAGRWRVTVLAAERRPAYDRVSLSSYFTGGSADSLRLPGADFAGDPLVGLCLGEAVTAVHPAGRTVTTSAGRELGYDALVLATGARPFVPPVPGHGLPGCFTYRTIDDLEAIEAAAAGATAGVVIGGGLLGLEAANALRSLGLATEVVEIAPHLMPAQVDEGGGALLAGLLAPLGVSARCGAGVEAITAGPDGRVAAVTLAGGTRLAAGLVVFSAGIRPCDELGRAAGLAAGERGGILTDRACRTADPHIYAIGDCAAPDGRGYGLVAPAYAMADTVAAQLLGGQASLPDADTATKLKLLGVDVASFGDAHARTAGALSVVVSNPAAGTYGKLVVSDDARTLLGGVLVGDASQFAVLRPLVGRPLPGDPVGLIAGPGATAGGAAGLAGLPGDAMICSCHAVPKDAIVSAVAGGAADVAAVKACTKAGTGCGSCLPALRQLLELGGAAQPKGLCEHFSYSRAELFEIAAATPITTFSDLIAARGQGRGCDICKPAVASILATLGSAAGRGGHILDGEQAALQDTNDHFLANLQRNGTYSVVPRIPAGEITPEKLITIGEVARDFGLYTKITGAQRIDLLGARVEQLPAIWGRLVAAGFESGHAYGKAVRTVKSCVGSTWCRYGVQDSVALAIELEMRYRGLRSPHKIKAAVSGCARECAEARGKDFGVIATEKGWNLYVGGNGGFQPRHADLLLADAGHDLLVTVIDRFLAFYVRTAERLQRTSTWIEAMDGGLGHLRSVIVDDSLGICAELEAAMAAHVRSYTDEWRGVLDDPGKLARFVSFVNAPGAPDPAVRFTVERGQPVPAPQPRASQVLLGMPSPAGGHRTCQPDLEGAGTR
jgi:nitrite reductase (NADH) large subunit